MAAVGAIAALAGMAIQVGSAIQQGHSAKALAEQNARYAETAAVETERAGAEDLRQQRVISQKQLGDMRANYAASGLDLSGSPLDWLSESTASAERDALNIKYNTESRARAYRQTGDVQLAQGMFAQQNANLSAIGYGLSGFSRSAQALSGNFSSGGSRRVSSYDPELD